MNYTQPKSILKKGATIGHNNMYARFILAKQQYYDSDEYKKLEQDAKQAAEQAKLQRIQAGRTLEQLNRAKHKNAQQKADADASAGGLKQPLMELPEVEETTTETTKSQNKKANKWKPKKSSNPFDAFDLLVSGVASITNAITEAPTTLKKLLTPKERALLQSENDDDYHRLVRQESDRLYGQQIRELTALLKQAEDEIRNLHPAAPMPVPILHVSTRNRAQVDNLRTKIDDLVAKKKRYEANMDLLNDSKQLFNDQLSSVMATSDAFLDQKAKTAEAEANATNLREAAKGWFGAIYPDSREGLAYKKGVLKFVTTKNKEYALGELFSRLLKYLEDLSYLPKTIDEFPVQYRDAARKAFTKDGKLLLEDQAFRDEFNANNVPLDDFEKKSDIAKNIVDIKTLPTQAQIDTKRQEIKLLQEANLFEIRDLQAPSKVYGLYYNKKYWPEGDVPKELKEKEEGYIAINNMLNKAENYLKVKKELDESSTLAENLYIAGKDVFWNRSPIKRILNGEKLGNVVHDVVPVAPAGSPGMALFLADQMGYTMQDVAIQLAANRVADKVTRGDKLNEQDRELLTAQGLLYMFQGEYGDYEQNNNTYKWSKIAMESLPFMAQFIATNGALTFLQGGASKLASKASHKLLRDVALKLVEKYGKTKATKMLVGFMKNGVSKAVSGAARLGADAIYATVLTNTLGLPKTLLDAVQASAPTVTADVDMFGNAVAQDTEDGSDFWKELGRSEVRNWIENFSEMMGEWGIGKAARLLGAKLPGVGKMLSKMESNITNAVQRDLYKTALNYMRRGVINQNMLLNAAKLKNFIPLVNAIFNSRTLRAGQFHGLFGEVSEEYYGLMLQHLFGVQDSPDKNLWQDIRDQSADIWGGIAVSTGLLGAFGIGSAVKSQTKFNAAAANLVTAFGEQLAQEIRRQLAFADPNYIMSTFFRLGEALGMDENLLKNAKARGTIGQLFGSADRQQVLADYVNSLLELRGAVFGEEALNRYMGQHERELQMGAKERGYSEAVYANLLQMEPVVSVLRNDISEKKFNGRSILDIYEANDGNVLSTINELEQNGATKEDVSGMLAYHNALNYVDGINMHFSDLVDARIKKSDTMVDRIKNRHTGRLVRIYRKETDPKHPDNPPKETSLFLIDAVTDFGDGVHRDGPRLHTVAGTDDVDVSKAAYGKNDKGKLLVADAAGHLKYVDRSQLEGYKFDTEQYDAETIKLARRADINRAAFSRNDEIYKNLESDFRTGYSIQLGDKNLTILDSYDGITYSVSDKDGKNSKIYYANDFKELKGIIERKLADETQNITKWFKDDADKLVKNAILKKAVRSAILKAEDDAITEQMERQQALWDQRDDDDDVIDTTPKPKKLYQKPETESHADISTAPEYLIPEDEDDTQSTSPPKEPIAPTGLSTPPVSPRIEQPSKPRRPADTPTPSASSVTDLESAMKSLRATIDAATKAKEMTTGYHYFIKVDGKTKLHKRVHTVKPDLYDNTTKKQEAEKLAAEIRESLKQVWEETHDTKQLHKKVELWINERANSLASISRSEDVNALMRKRTVSELKFSLGYRNGLSEYMRYLEDNPNDIDEVLDALSSILSSGKINPSVVVGNIYDEIARAVFDNNSNVQFDEDGRAYYYNDNSRVYLYDALQIYFYGEQLPLNAPTLVPETGAPKEDWLVAPLITEAAFNDIVRLFVEIKKYYEDTLGWQLCTTPFTLRGTLLVKDDDGNTKETFVAGETDCIAVDKEGKYHIVDFKTHNARYQYREQSIGGILINDAYYENATITDDDANRTPIETYSLAEEHAMQMYLYKLLAESMGVNVESSETLLFGVQKTLKTSAGVFLDENNVKNSHILYVDENGKLVPNRKNLDSLNGSRKAYHEFVKRIIKQTNDEIARAKFDLLLNLIELPDEIRDKISTILIQLIDECNAKTNELLNSDANEVDAKKELLRSIGQHLNYISAIKNNLQTALDNLKTRLEQEGIARKYLEHIYPTYTSSQLLGVLFQQYDISYQDAFLLIVNTPQDIALDDEQCEQFYEELILMKALITIIERAGILNDPSLDDTSKKAFVRCSEIINSHIEEYITNNSLNYDYIDSIRNDYKTQIEDIIESGANSQVETQLSRKTSLQYTSLNDSADMLDSTATTVEKSQSEDGTKLADVITNADFIINAEFYVVPAGMRGNNPIFALLVVYDGKTFDPVTITFGHESPNGEGGLNADSAPFYKELVSKFKTPGTTRVKLKNANFSRTLGRIENSELHKIDEEEMYRLTGKSIEAIHYDKESSDVGLTRVVIKDGVAEVVVTAPGTNEFKFRTIYTYSGNNESSNPVPGVVVLLYEPNYLEENQSSKITRDRVVPINLETTNFTPELAKFVVDVLSGKYSLSKGGTLDEILNSRFIYTEAIFNEECEAPFTNKDVILLFMSIDGHNQKGPKRHVRLKTGAATKTEETNLEENKTDGEARKYEIHVEGVLSGISQADADGRLISVNSESYDIRDADSMAKLAKYLCDNVRMQVFSDFMANLLSDSAVSINDVDVEIPLGDTGITLSSDDMDVSGIAWYIKNGILLTRFDHMERPLISINEKDAIDQDAAEPAAAPESAASATTPSANAAELSDNGTSDDIFKLLEEENPKEGSEGYVENFDEQNLSSTVLQLCEPENQIDEAAARLHIKEILGDVPVTFVDEILGTCQNGQIVAACYQNSIKMSRLAERGTEYHEAFHRILELLVPKKVRDRAYKSYRKKFGEHLTDNEIAERAADEFWWYKLNKPLKKWSWNLKKLLDIIKQWYKFYTHIGSRNLYLLYSSASSGKYAKCLPTQEAIERWKVLTKQKGFLPFTYTLNNIGYKHIMNHKEYDAVVETIKSIALSNDTYKGSGVSLNASTISSIYVDADMIVKSPRFWQIMRDPIISNESKRKILDVLGYTLVRVKDKDGARTVAQKDKSITDNRAEKVMAAVRHELNKYGQREYTYYAEYSKTHKGKQAADEEQGVDYTEQFLLRTEDANATTRAEDAATGEIDESGADEAEFTEERQFGEFLKVSSEFDPVTRASQRVKFFFARMMDFVYRNEIADAEKGTVVRKQYVKRNAAGLPQMMDYKLAWSLVLNKVYWCRTIRELYDRLQQISSEDAFYQEVFNQYRQLLLLAFETVDNSVFDKSGKPNAVKNESAAGMATELVSVLCHAKNIPLVIQSVQNSETEANHVRVMDSSMEYTVRETRKSWTAAIMSGESKYIDKDQSGNYSVKKPYTPQTLKSLAEELGLFPEVFKSASTEIKVKGSQKINLNIKLANGESRVETVTVKDIKDNPVYTIAYCLQFVNNLNDLGIGFSMDDFMFMLNNQYSVPNGDNSLSQKLSRFADDNAGAINGSFKNHIITLASLKKTQQYRKFVESLWTNEPGSENYSSFIDIISKARYHRICNERMLSFLTIGGKKQYAMGEHNFITDRTDEMKVPVGGEKLSKMQELAEDPYWQGSMVFDYILNEANNEDKQNMEFAPCPGMKTDMARSTGIEYLDFSEQEDVVAKYGMLKNNGILLPTMADKTTFGCIYLGKKFKVFGIDWTGKFKNNEAGYLDRQRSFSTNYVPGTQEIRGRSEIYLLFNDSVLDQFIRYAYSEYNSAKQQWERYNRRIKNNPELRVANYYGNDQKVTINGKETTVTVILGARLSTFTGIFDENGEFISFNHLKVDEGGKERVVHEDELLSIAEREFFNQREGESKLQQKIRQRKAMSKILSHLVLKELDYLADLGMIEYDDSVKMYKNKRLDSYSIQQADFLLHNGEQFKSVRDLDAIKGVDHNNALILYVADMVSKAQMSHQECYRMFAGNLASYKWIYDSETGALKNVTQDFFKRLGGLVSTGTHNVPDVPNIPKKIRCAEMKDEVINSPISDEFLDKAKEQEYRRMLKSLRLSAYERRVEDGDTKSTGFTIDDLDNSSDKAKIAAIRAEIDLIDAEDLEAELRKELVKNRAADLNEDERYSPQQVREYAEKEADAIIENINTTVLRQHKALCEVNVTDGATYISDELCEYLLRSIGKWNNSIAQAFELLRGKKDDVSNASLLDKVKAYQMIYTSVIGTQKYTAFGQRFEKLSNDDKGAAVTYFDKTAYFPLFDCMATGHTRAVLKKMHDQGIHMLKTTSAIKEGGRGGVSLNTKTFDNWEENPDAFDEFQFNTYEQDFDEVRKQFNTDPKGKEYMPLGSQYQKVVLSLLLADTIIDVNGVELDALQVREEVMKCYLEIMDAGKKKHDSKFYKITRIPDPNNPGKTIEKKEHNVDAFVEVLSKQLADRDVSDPMLEALTVEEVDVPNPDNPKETIKKRRTKLPFAALSNTKWIESIVSSIVNKDIIDVTAPGAAFYQRSAWGVEGKLGENLGSKVLDAQDRWLYTINHGAPLKAINEEGSMDVVLSIDFFDYLFKALPALMHQSFAAKKNWLIKNGIISGFGKNAETFTVEAGDVYIEESIKDDKTVYNTVEIAEGDSRIGTEVTARKWHNAKTNIVGYRIPTLAVSSIHAMRCVDVLPVVRDTVIMPKEITAESGSDFDIDKFFMNIKYYRETVDEEAQKILDDIVNSESDGKFGTEADMIRAYKNAVKTAKKAKVNYNNIKIGSEEYDKLSEDVKTALDTINLANKIIKSAKTKNGTKGYSETLRKSKHLTDVYDENMDQKKHFLNRLLDLQIALLTSNDNNMSKLHGSIDVDTVRLKEIANELSKRNPSRGVDPFDASSLRLNVQAKLAFAIGKSGIGPYALNNNNHVFTMLYGIKFIDGKHQILKSLGLQDLSRSFDRHGRSIMSWISGLINAHVDVAKEPYIRELGVNSYTYNLVSLLIRTGYGEETFWFTTQPIMRLLYAVYDQASGVYNQDETLSKYARTTNAVNTFFSEKVLQITGKQSYFSDPSANIALVEEYIRKKYNGVTLATLIKGLMKNKEGVDVMRRIATSPQDQLNSSYNVCGISVSYDDLLLIILVANFLLQDAAKDLSTLVQYTKIDTKKHGKSVIEQQAYLDTFESLTDPRRSPFESAGIRNMINRSFIGPKTRAAIEAMSGLLSLQIIEATEGFKDLVDQVRGKLNSSRTDEDFITSLSKMIIAKLKADYFFKGENCYCKQRGINPASLVNSKKGRSIYKQLFAIKAGVSNLADHRYDSIRDPNTGQCNNYLINALITHVFAIDKEDSVTRTPEQKLTDPEFQDEWMDAQFIKSQNINEDVIKQSDMQNAWLDLLNDSSNPELQEFAERLIVYAFMTSAATGGSLDLFKYVPPAWMTGDCSRLDQTLDKRDTFSSYMNDLLDKLNSQKQVPMFTEDELDEMILNFAYDDNIVKTQSRSKITKTFESVMGMSGKPILFGAISSKMETVYGDNFPAFIKVRTFKRYGQRKYDIYKVVAMGQKRDGLATYLYPIYGLVAPSGGTYKGGQKIYSMDILNTTNGSDFREYWALELNKLFTALRERAKNEPALEPIYKQLVRAKDPATLFSILLTVLSSAVFKDIKDDVLSELSELVKDDPLLLYETLNSLLENVAAYQPNDKFSYFSRDSYNEAIPTVDFYETSTELNIKDERYKRIDIDSDSGKKQVMEAFGNDIFDKVADSNLHIEFYKKLFEVDGKKYHNVVLTVSLNYANAKGWFEADANVDIKDGKAVLNNEYDLHFKTYVSKMGSDTTNARVPLNEGNKNAMMRELVYLLPEGAIISTSGTVSKGGLNALNTLEQYVKENARKKRNSSIIKLEETRTVTSEETNKEVNIPVYKKSNASSASLVNSAISSDTPIPTLSVKQTPGVLPISDEIKNEMNKAYEELTRQSQTYQSDRSILDNILSDNERFKLALINSGNSLIDVFEDNSLNNTLTALRTTLQLSDSAKETNESCHVNK